MPTIIQIGDGFVIMPDELGNIDVEEIDLDALAEEFFWDGNNAPKP